MNRKTSSIAAWLLVGCFLAPSAFAGISADQIARLQRDLTPIGAERAGNADGTIPEWTGGITEPPPGYSIGDSHPDPYAEDPILFVISADNIDEYRDRLTPGHQRLLEAYPTYRMPVFPTRRSGSFPQRIYDATRVIAATARLVDGGNGISGAVIGIPFPIPNDGLEVIWNHLLRYRGTTSSCIRASAAVTRGGDYTLIKSRIDSESHYHQPGMTEDQLDNTMFRIKQKHLSPARLAGNIVLVHETLNQVIAPRRSWTYNLGQRRVRRAPNISYDQVGAASDGLQTVDQRGMFNGAVDRYEWKLVGKREVYVPYNAYALNSQDLSVSDILIPLHVNPDHTRYELHRVWVVEATLREGARHIYKRRTLYIDEDSWQILFAEHYDNRDQLWRISESHQFNMYETPLLRSTIESHMDLQSGRYFAVGVNNDHQVCTLDPEVTLRDFTPAALRREGK